MATREKEVAGFVQQTDESRPENKAPNDELLFHSKQGLIFHFLNFFQNLRLISVTQGQVSVAQR